MILPMKFPAWRLWLLAVIAALTCASASAQLSTATIYGTITDSTGAAVPNATITLTQTDTNFKRVSTTKADGTYHEEFLPVGPYKISISSPGFKTLQRSGVVLCRNAERLSGSFP